MTWRILVLVLCLSALPARAASIHVLESSGVGVSDLDLRTMTELVRSAVTRAGRHDLLDAAPASAGTEAFTLRPKLIRLGSSYVAGLEKQRAGRTVFSAELKIQRIDELDTAVGRLAESVLEEKPVERTAVPAGAAPAAMASVPLKSSSPSAAPARTPGVSRYFVSVGPAFSANLEAADPLVNLSGAYAWNLDPTILRVFADVTFSSDDASSDLLALGFGAQHSFATELHAPFVGAEAGFGTSTRDGTDRVSGVLIELSGGYHFYRTSAVALELSARYTALLADNGEGIPQLFALRFGIYFHF